MDRQSKWGRSIAVILVAGALAVAVGAAAADEAAAPGTAGGKEPAPAAEDAGAKVLSFLKSVEFSGGVSAGWFYASHPGPDTSDNEALVSNFLLGVATTDKGALVGFDLGVGQTSTPSVLSTPEQNRDYRVEYAALLVHPIPDGELAVGLLKPIAGYEDTYTYNNRNVVHGIVASQQPYNAYGARVKYSVAGVELNAGYYSKRLAEDEYEVDLYGDGSRVKRVDRAWEVTAGGEAAGLCYRAYYYHLEGMKALAGAVLEYTVGNVALGLNGDYWRWTGSLSSDFDRKYAMGLALYVAPSFGSFSLPVRVEYVNQGGSRIYVDNADTKTLWSATVTPTYKVTEKAYVRAEASFVHGRDAFADDDGNAKSSRVYLAGEVGYVF